MSAELDAILRFAGDLFLALLVAGVVFVGAIHWLRK